MTNAAYPPGYETLPGAPAGSGTGLPLTESNAIPGKIPAYVPPLTGPQGHAEPQGASGDTSHPTKLFTEAVAGPTGGDDGYDSPAVFEVWAA